MKKNDFMHLCGITIFGPQIEKFNELEPHKRVTIIRGNLIELLHFLGVYNIFNTPEAILN